MSRDQRQSDNEQFAKLLGECDEALAAGKTVEEATTVVRQADPELAARVVRAVQCVESLYRARHVCGNILQTEGAGAPSTRSATSSRGAESSAAVDLSPPGESRVPARIGRFEIVRELGRGGYGIVYLARDPNLDRTVALKVPRPEVLVTPELKRRFLREARTAAGLNHAHVVTVYETGVDGPICWIAEEYCKGMSLAARLAERDQPIQSRAAAELVADLADGVEHAHCHGILHRDLKPSNVALVPVAPDRLERAGTDDELADITAKLTDFGLAKCLEQDGLETRTGAVLGTPCYMAPEQVDDQYGQVGRRTDVYGLGAILYEMLTGRPPLRGGTSTDTLRRVLLDDPVPPTRLRRALDRDLESICLKCLEKQPRHRYATAGALATDLRRFLAGVATEARPPGPLRRLAKWAHRHPAVGTALAATLIALVAILAGGTWHVRRLQRELTINRQLRRAAELRQRQQRHDQYRSDIRLAQRLWQEDKLEQTAQLLARYLPDRRTAGPSVPGSSPSTATDGGGQPAGARGGDDPHAIDQEDLRDFAWYYLWQRCHGQLTTYRGHTDQVTAIGYSPDGRKIATAAHDGTARTFDTQSGRELLVLGGHQGDVNAVVFTPDGQVLATADDGGVVRLWDVKTGHILATFHGHDGDALCLAMAPDGRRLASGGIDGTIRLWDVQEHVPIETIQAHTDWVRAVVFSPDGRTLASASDDGTVKLWNVGAEPLLRKTLEHGSWVLSLAFSPQGNLLVTGCKNRKVQFWDVKAGKAIGAPLDGGGWVRGVALSGNGEYLAAVGTGPLIKLWNVQDVAAPKLVRRIPGHTRDTWAVVFAPDNRTMATASADGLAKRWRVGDDPTWDEYWDVGASGTGFQELVVSPDGSRVAFTLRSGGKSTELHVWDRSRRTEVVMRKLPWSVEGLAVSPENRYLAFTGSKEPVQLLNLAAPDHLESLGGKGGPFADITFHPAGTQVAMVRGDNTFWLYDLMGHAARHVALDASRHAGLRSVCFLPDGKTLAATDYPNDAVILYDLESASVRATLPAGGHGLAVSADGRLLASGAPDRTVRIWDTRTGRQLQRLTGHDTKLSCLAFSPDGRVLATAAAADRRLKIWSVDSAEKLLAISTPFEAVSALAFTPDGKALIAGGVWRQEVASEHGKKPGIAFFSGGDSALRGEIFLFRAD